MAIQTPSHLQKFTTLVIIEVRMESQQIFIGLTILATILFSFWFFVGRKGGYGEPTRLNMRKGENDNSSKAAVVQAERKKEGEVGSMRDVTPQVHRIEKAPQPPGPPPQCFFVYNGHDWDAFEVLGVSPYSGFADVTKAYQQQIKKADPGKHEFLQTAYMALLKKF